MFELHRHYRHLHALCLLSAQRARARERERAREIGREGGREGRRKRPFAQQIEPLNSGLVYRESECSLPERRPSTIWGCRRRRNIDKGICKREKLHRLGSARTVRAHTHNSSTSYITRHNKRVRAPANHAAAPEPRCQLGAAASSGAALRWRWVSSYVRVHTSARVSAAGAFGQCSGRHRAGICGHARADACELTPTSKLRFFHFGHQ